MITFNELRMSDDKESLIVHAVINTDGALDGVTIDSAYLVYYKNLNEHGIPDIEHKAYEITPTSDTTIDAVIPTTALASMQLDCEDFGDKIFYVVVTTTADAETLAELEELGYTSGDFVDIGVIVDWLRMYNQGMPYVAKLALNGYNKCNKPMSLEEFVIIWHALKVALAACDFEQIAALWDRFLRVTSVIPFTPDCGCNG